MRALIESMLSRLVGKSRLDIVFADGSQRSVGAGSDPGLTMRILDRPTELKLALNPELALGEAVMDGRVVVERGSLYELLDILIAGASRQELTAWTRPLTRFRTAIRRITQNNNPAWARRNVAHHYDLRTAFFRLFLDEDLQ